MNRSVFFNAGLFVDGKLTPAEQREYECVLPKPGLLHPWWGNLSGPCCRPNVKKRTKTKTLNFELFLGN